MAVIVYSKCCLRSGWPSISLQIWHYDEFGRQELYGYGSIYLPASPGEHQVNTSLLMSVCYLQWLIKTFANNYKFWIFRNRFVVN